jgi:hypothetical protein
MAREMYGTSSDVEHRSGWVSFAGYLLLTVGFFQIIAGLVAIFEPNLYVATANHLLVFDYSQWGWIHFLLGLVSMTGGASLLAGKMWGRTVAVVYAVLSAIANFAFIWAYPLLSILIIAMDIMIIYAVIVYGGRQRE